MTYWYCVRVALTGHHCGVEAGKVPVLYFMPWQKLEGPYTRVYCRGPVKARIYRCAINKVDLTKC